MPRNAEFVQIEAKEDVASIKDRLSFYRGQNVLLIWPEEGTALIRKLDLVLIQREAMRRAIRLALVTHDETVIRHARELNISTFETIGASERGRWKRGRAKVFTSRFQKPKHEPEPEELQEVASRVRVQLPEVPALRRTLVRLGVLGVLIGVVLAVAYVIVPGATVYITPAEQVVEQTIEIVADPGSATRDVDVESRIIPTQLLRATVEDTLSIATTGTQDRDDVQALGSVFFTNLTNSEVNIPAGTTLSTGTGTPVTFRTTVDAVLPAGTDQEVEVAVEAMPTSAGEIGNVGINLITTVIGPLENSVTVANRAPTSGGENRSVRAVSEEDRDRLLLQMRGQLQGLAFAQMQSQLSTTQFVIDATIGIVEEREDWTLFSAEIGTATDTLTLTMRATVEATVVDESLAQQVVFAYMAGQIPRGRIITPESITYERGPFAVDPETNLITFSLTGRGQIRGQVNQGLLQDRLSGLTVDDAMIYLQREVDLLDGSVPRIELSPGWFDRMPVLAMRIDIVVEGE